MPSLMTMLRSRRPSFPAEYQLRRLGLSFRNAETERAYRSWRVGQSIMAAISVGVTAIVCSLSASLASYFWVPHIFWEMAAATLLVLPLIMLAAGFLVIRPRYRAKVQHILAVTVLLVQALLIVTVLGIGLDSHGLVFSLLTSLVLLVFSSLFVPLVRLSPRFAAAALTPSFAVLVLMALQGFQQGQLDRVMVGVVTGMGVMSVVSVVAICTLSERLSRYTFVQERIIDQQRRDLDDERAQLSRFLAPEVIRMIREKGLEATLTRQTLELTVVSCDLRGFTAYTRVHGPQAMGDVLQDYYELIVDVAAGYGGTVKDFAGDGALILLGAPAPRQDHAEAGLALARDLLHQGQKMLRRYHSVSSPLGIGVGVASGPCAVGAVGSQHRLEYTAVGRPVNMAARLCAEAQDGELVIAPDTVQRVQAQVPTEQGWTERKLQLKGFQSSITAMVEQVS